ncbi:MAG: methyltransferase domain-containing protein [Bacteroidetes bacterium]|nr:methyltransferase domain-containing protein [Bacteroidota bacterium]
MIQAYSGEPPFAIFLKDFFRTEKKIGSTDRKWIRHFAFSYFRMGKSLPGVPVPEVLCAGLFLCTHDEGAWTDILPEEWKNNIHKFIPEKLLILQKYYPGFDAEHIFPLTNELPESMDIRAFSLSHLQQPDTFIRIRPGKKKFILSVLNQKEIPYRIVDENCLAFKPDTPLQDVLHIGKDVIIQDFSSQQVSEFFSGISPRTIWDCCAGSGGKSILAKDYFKDIQLYVSDIRENILHNLTKRFRDAGIHAYQLVRADLTMDEFSLTEKMDLVICDAPCSGSGTWGRSPENLVYFDSSHLDHYISLQKKMIANVLQQVKPKGYFLYITCSVYEKENEGAVNFIMQKFPFQLLRKKWIKGFENRADSMFAALFQKL